MKLTLEEAERKVLNLPYFETVWEEGATDKHIHDLWELRTRIDHAAHVCGISAFQQNLQKVDRLLRFYDMAKKPNKNYSKEFIENVKEQARYLRSKREFILEELARLKKQMYIEIED